MDHERRFLVVGTPVHVNGRSGTVWVVHIRPGRSMPDAYTVKLAERAGMPSYQGTVFPANQVKAVTTDTALMDQAAAADRTHQSGYIPEWLSDSGTH